MGEMNERTVIDHEVNAAVTAFVDEMRPRLPQALVARLGPDRGADGLSHALAIAWERWDKAAPMENRVGYLYRVGISRGRGRITRSINLFPAPSPRTESHGSSRSFQGPCLVSAQDSEPQSFLCTVSAGRSQRRPRSSGSLRAHSRPILNAVWGSYVRHWRWKMSDELVVQLDRYGDYLDEHTADVMTDHTSGGSQLMMERVERRQGTPALVWLIAAAIAVLVGILAIALLTSSRDVATDPDVGVPEIDAWLAARNIADLEALRALTDPTSPQMAWVFQSGATGLDALRLLGQADFVFDCEISSSEFSDTSYRCSRENRWPLAEAIGMDLGGSMEWEIRIAAGGVASYALAGGTEEYSGHRLPLPVANYLCL